MARASLVTAPAGVGKSRLRHELLRAARGARQRVEIWIGRGDPMSAGSPFGAARAGAPARGAASSTASRSRVRRAEAPRARRRATSPPDDVDARRRVPRRARRRAASPTTSEPCSSARRAQRPAADGRPDAPRLRGLRSPPSARRSPVLLVLEDLHWGDLPDGAASSTRRCATSRDRPLHGARARAARGATTLFPRLWAERGVERDPPRRADPQARPSSSCAQVLGDGVADDATSRGSSSAPPATRSTSRS